MDKITQNITIFIKVQNNINFYSIKLLILNSFFNFLNKKNFSDKKKINTIMFNKKKFWNKILSNILNKL